jgi:diguanylate cyclase (GGDEF)-like protein/PAS domain S-box-containing protein
MPVKKCTKPVSTSQPAAHPAKPAPALPIVGIGASDGEFETLRALEERNDLFLGILRSTSDGILAVDRENQILFASERFVEMWRIPQEIMATKDDALLLQYVLDQLSDPQGFLKKVQDLYHSTEESFDTLYFKDGRIFERLSHPMLQGTEVRGRVWSFRDITARKQIEDALGQSEERYRDIVENSQDLICTHDLHGRILSVNLAASKSLGYPLDEIIGRNIRDFLAPGREKAFTAYLREIKEKGVANGLLQLLNNNGEKRIWEFNNSLRTEGVKKPIVRGMARDITKRFKVEKALREGESSLQGILRATADGILAVGRENQVLFANERFAKIWRIPQAVITSKDDTVLLQYVLDQLSDPQGFLKKVQELYRSAEESFDTLYFKDGRIFERLSRPMLQGTEVRGRVWSFRDITARRQAENLQDAVYRIAQAADQAESLDALYPSIHAIVQEVMTADNFYIALYDEENDLLSFPYLVDEEDPSASPQKPGKGLTEYVLRSGKSVLCDEALYEGLIQRGEIELVGAHSPIWLGVPLNIAGKAIGVMVVQDYKNAQAYTDRERHILEFVSSQVAMAIYRKQAEAQIRASETELRALFAGMTDVVIVYDANGRYNEIAPTNPANLYRPPENMLGMLVHDILPKEQADYIVARIREAIQSGQVVTGEYVLQIDGREIWFSSSASPLSENAVVWVAHDITERKQAEDELRRAKDLLETANLELQQSLEREKLLASTDELTGLCNRRHFFELASREFHASLRHRRSLTILMFDADEFKQINDTFGHAAGDKMLVEIAQAAVAQVRVSDVVARYGGDEFIILLPNASAQQAFPIAERIRASVAAIRLGAENAMSVMTLSIGISEIRHEPVDESIDRVIQRADQALYKAKQCGRNCIVIGEH